MKKAIYGMVALSVVLGIGVMALWLLPWGEKNQPLKETRYGMSEGLELVEWHYATGSKYVVEDEGKNVLFGVPLRNCVIDTHYRNGQLRFREQGSRREGYVDRQGMVAFLDDKTRIPESAKTGTSVTFATDGKSSAKPSSSCAPVASSDATALGTPPSMQKVQPVSQVSLQAMAHADPFYKEAAKIMQGKLTEQDAKCRHTILNYCEHLRAAYTTKDLDFLRQVFSDKALIIVGNVVKATADDTRCQAEPRVSYAIHSKQDYISRLGKVFALNKKIDVRFSGFRILRHPTMDGIYGVTLRQQYHSDRYADDGYLFLLWDFRDKSMPLIHVRTWQPASSVTDGDDVISMQDFNLR